MMMCLLFEVGEPQKSGDARERQERDAVMPSSGGPAMVSQLVKGATCVVFGGHGESLFMLLDEDIGIIAGQSMSVVTMRYLLVYIRAWS